jgi:hypothetical protein
MALTRGGNSVQQIRWIAKTHILLEPWAYLSSTGPVFVRGLFAATGLLGLIGVFHLPRMLRWSRTGPTYPATMSVVLSTVALLIINALMTANPAGLNPTLVFVYAYAIAYVAAGL